MLVERESGGPCGLPALCFLRNVRVVHATTEATIERNGAPSELYPPFCPSPGAAAVTVPTAVPFPFT
jgi:hypothetical protein